jgi:hypothetical protein
MQPTPTDLYYVFIVRKDNKWSNFIIIKRDELYELHVNDKVGTANKSTVQLYLSFKNNKVYCSSKDLTKYNNNWDAFPKVTH